MKGADSLVAHLAALITRSAGSRVGVGLTGPPGAGKSTLASRLAAELDGVVVPMDGFHLPNEELDRLGLRARKGAPETFDAAGFVELVAALMSDDGTVTAPSFDRVTDEPVPDAISVPSETDVLVVEGNYLLLDEPPWNRLRDLLDVIVYIDLDPAVRVQRLVDRHVRHGRAPDDARRFVARSDEANARLIEMTSTRADLVVNGS